MFIHGGGYYPGEGIIGREVGRECPGLRNKCKATGSSTLCRRRSASLLRAAAFERRAHLSETISDR